MGVAGRAVPGKPAGQHTVSSGSLRRSVLESHRLDLEVLVQGRLSCEHRSSAVSPAPLSAHRTPTPAMRGRPRLSPRDRRDQWGAGAAGEGQDRGYVGVVRLGLSLRVAQAERVEPEPHFLAA